MAAVATQRSNDSASALLAEAELNLRRWKTETFSVRLEAPSDKVEQVQDGWSGARDPEGQRRSGSVWKIGSSNKTPLSLLTSRSPCEVEISARASSLEASLASHQGGAQAHPGTTATLIVTTENVRQINRSHQYTARSATGAGAGRGWAMLSIPFGARELQFQQVRSWPASVTT